MKSYVLLPLLLFIIQDFVAAQEAISQIEGYLEVGLANDSTSIFIGKKSGQKLTRVNASNNVVGTLSGLEITTGIENSFFGTESGMADTSGYRNSFFGYRSGAGNTSGYLNSCFGFQAGDSLTFGRLNSFFGALAGSNSASSTNNAFFGYAAGESNFLGFNNSFFGSEACRYITIGERNNFIGENSGRNIDRGNNNICIGRESGPTINVSDRLYIDIERKDDPLIFGNFDTDLVTINGFLQLGPRDYFAGNDDGVILSPSTSGSDIFLTANDAVIVEIGTVISQNGTFEIWDGATDEVLFKVDEDGNLEIKGSLTEGASLARGETTGLDEVAQLKKEVEALKTMLQSVMKELENAKK